MRVLHNKPKVFLSHSKKDIEFIKKIESDLRKCQIDPWLDEIEIRHGKPWMNEIFENGIPTCDAILVYFTENSLPSKVVRKEIDAGLLQNLDDNNVAFLPYVINSDLREQLRSDIQVLQTPEWNESNYYEILPRVVAEIWRSFLERTVESAIKEEKLKRIQAELELEKNRNQREDFFTLSENTEFEYFFGYFNKDITVICTIADKSISEAATVKQTIVNINLLRIICSLRTDHNNTFKEKDLESKLNIMIKEFMNLNQNNSLSIELNPAPKLWDELLLFGLLENFSYPNPAPPLDSSRAAIYYNSLLNRTIYSEKYSRFVYWLTFHQKIPEVTISEET